MISVLFQISTVALNIRDISTGHGSFADRTDVPYENAKVEQARFSEDDC